MNAVTKRLYLTIYRWHPEIGFEGYWVTHYHVQRTPSGYRDVNTADGLNAVAIFLQYFFYCKKHKRHQ